MIARHMRQEQLGRLPSQMVLTLASGVLMPSWAFPAAGDVATGELRCMKKSDLRLLSRSLIKEPAKGLTLPTSLVDERCACP